MNASANEGGSGDAPSNAPQTIGHKSESTRNYYWRSVLCICFGMGTWLPVNAMYTQMPIFVQTAPEGWSLPSYFSILVQTANISPLMCYIFRKKLASRHSSLISCYLIVGTVSMFALAFTHQIVSIVFGAKHSAFFFVFSFFISLVGCTSSVLFLPFMNKLPESYLIPFFIGEGLSGLVPSFIALLQGVGKDPICIDVILANGTKTRVSHTEEPVFTSTIFLSIMAVIMCASTVSFQYLNCVSSVIRNEIRLEKSEPRTYKTQNRSDDVSNLSKTTVIILLSLQAYVNFFSNGVLPSIQSYSCLPYGTLTYHWSVNLNHIVGPIIIYSAFFLPVVSTRVLAVCSIIQSMCLGYELVTAFTSPTPPLVGTSTGVALIVS